MQAVHVLSHGSTITITHGNPINISFVIADVGAYTKPNYCTVCHTNNRTYIKSFSRTHNITFGTAICCSNRHPNVIANNRAHCITISVPYALAHFLAHIITIIDANESSDSRSLWCSFIVAHTDTNIITVGITISVTDQGTYCIAHSRAFGVANGVSNVVTHSRSVVVSNSDTNRITHISTLATSNAFAIVSADGSTNNVADRITNSLTNSLTFWQTDGIPNSCAYFHTHGRSLCRTDNAAHCNAVFITDSNSYETSNNDTDINTHSITHNGTHCSPVCLSYVISYLPPYGNAIGNADDCSDTRSDVKPYSHTHGRSVGNTLTPSCDSITECGAIGYANIITISLSFCAAHIDTDGYSVAGTNHLTHAVPVQRSTRQCVVR